MSINKTNIMDCSLKQAVWQYEREFGKLTEDEKKSFMDGFNYACLLMVREN